MSITWLRFESASVDQDSEQFSQFLAGLVTSYG